MDTSKFTPGVIVILAAGLVALIFSFLPFYTFDAGGGGGRDAAEEACDNLPDDLADECRDAVDDAGGGGDQNFSAWSTDGLFPLATLPVIYCVLMAIYVGLAKLANVNFPERILGMTSSLILIAFGVNAAILMLAFLVRDKDPLDFGIGFFFVLLASLAAAVGAVLYQREEAAGPPTAPPSA